MNRVVGQVVAVAAVLALAWMILGRLGDTASADQAGSPAQTTVPEASLPEAAAGQDPTSFQWPAGHEYRLSNRDVASFKASLAPLWTWDGEVGTYGDGQTQVRVVAEGGRVAGVEILHNASIIADACLKAQLLYGVSVDGAGVQAACAGMWTKEWAQSQVDRNNQDR